MAEIASESVSTPLTLLLFGPMQVLVHDRPLPPVRSRKALWLLALLALRHGRPVEREWLAETLWPDADQRRAATNLRANLSELRRALGDERERLRSPSRHTLALDLQGAHVDVLTFDAALRQQTPPALTQAVALYRMPLLQDCAEPWVLPERRERQQACLLALQTLGDAALAAGELQTAIAFYQRAVGLDPWREAARRGWMRALAASGDRNAALQVYREFVQRLRSDPRALPDAQTRALYTQLRTQARQKAAVATVDPAKPPVVSEGRAAVLPEGGRALPPPLPDLIGRDTERIEATRTLRVARLLTLTGAGGIGKTRLARAVAADLPHDTAAYPDGVWFVALETLEPGGTLAAQGARIVAQIAAVLGMREEPARSLQDSLVRHLRSRRLVLVLDNCEHLLSASAQIVGHLLGECAQVRLLATSREALGITGETCWQVPSLGAPDPSQLPSAPTARVQALETYASVELFVVRAQACEPDFTLTPANAEAVGQICHHLEGLPLAIELAAARVNALGVDQIAGRLSDQLGLLTRGKRTGQARQQTLRATLDWSYALLSEAEQLVLGRLSVFAGGWTLEAGEEVCGGEGIEAGQILDRLASLVAKSLVVFEERAQEEGGRYRLLETVRQYAAERLIASGRAEQIKIRHRDWSLLLAEAAALHLKSGDQRHWLQQLDREYDNLRAALTWSETDRQEAEAELRLVGALSQFWYIRGYYSEGRQYLQNALNREDAQAKTMTRALALNGAGVLAYDQGDYIVARALFEERLRIARQWEDRMSIASALGNLGNVALAVGEMGSSRALYEESLALKRELDDRAGVALMLSNLGIIVRQQGDYASAKNCFEESLSISKALDDKIGMARVLLNMGNLAWNQDDPVLERTCIEESLSIFQELGDKQGIARSLGNLGASLNRAGEWEAARTCIEESQRIFQELGDRHGVALALGNLGSVVYDQGEHTSARTLYEESLNIFRKLGDRHGMATALSNLGRGAHDQGEYVLARKLHEESLSICRELKKKPDIVESLEALAMVMLAQEEVLQAVRLLGAIHTLRETLGIPLPPSKREKYKRQMEQSCSMLGKNAFDAAWEEGRVLSWEQAVALSAPVEESGG